MSQIPPTGTAPGAVPAAPATPATGPGGAPTGARTDEAASGESSSRTAAPAPSPAEAAMAVRAENVRVQGPGLAEATRAAQDALTRVQTADEGLARVEPLLAAMGDAAAASRAAPEADGPQRVAEALTQELTTVVDRTRVGGEPVLAGVADPSTLGLEGLSLAAPEALDAIDAAAARVSEARGELASSAQGFALVLGELVDGSPNAAAAQIRDLDTAREVAASAEALLLHDPIAAVTAQANVVPTQVQALLA